VSEPPGCLLAPVQDLQIQLESEVHEMTLKEGAPQGKRQKTTKRKRKERVLQCNVSSSCYFLPLKLHAKFKMSLLENDFSVDYSTFTTGTKDMKNEDAYVSISILLRNQVWIPCHYHC